MNTPVVTVVVLLSVLSSACDRSAELPAAPDPPGSTTPPLSSARLAIEGAEGPTAAGRTLQLKATVTLADGSESDVSAFTSWRSEKPDVAAVSPSGTVEIHGVGDVDIVASYKTLSATTRVTSGYVVSGFLHEADPFTQVAVADAEVDVVGGELAGRKIVTDSEGRFSLPPVTTAGFELQFKKEGYDTRRYQIAGLPRDEQLSVALLQKQKTFSWNLDLRKYDPTRDFPLFYRESFPIAVSRTSPVTLRFTGTGKCHLQGTYTDTAAGLRDGPSPPIVVFPYSQSDGNAIAEESETITGGKYTLSIGFMYVSRQDCHLSVTLLYH